MKAATSKTDLRLLRGVKARKEILQAAERIFAERGLEGARTGAIAAAAGVNKALLFYHFKSKDELFTAVVEESIGEIHRCLMKLLSSQGPAKEVLLCYVDTFFEAIARRPHNTAVFLRAMRTDSKLAERMMQKFFIPRTEKLAALIRRGVRGREFRPVDGLQTALLITSLMVFQFWGASVARHIGYDNPFRKSQLKKRKAAVADFIRHGLFEKQEVSPRDT